MALQVEKKGGRNWNHRTRRAFAYGDPSKLSVLSNKDFHKEPFTVPQSIFDRLFSIFPQFGLIFNKVVQMVLL